MNKNNEKIYVTKPILPNKERLQKYIDSIYDSNWLTNFGPLHELLRKRLASYLNVDNITLTANGTLALIVAYKILNVKKAITTPFTFVATISSMLWEGIDLVFADIDKETFCIDVNQVEDLLKKDKTIDTVVAVNVFGNACDIEDLYFLKEKYGIKLIFDSSHCFNVYYDNKNILSYGDASTISFHATKLFHTIEGGGIVFGNPEYYEKARKCINFGFETYYKITELGINAKMNEFEAAMGLALLEEIDFILEQRKKAWEYYYFKLKGVVEFQKRNDKSTNNYSYFPILLSSEEVLLNVLSTLEKYNIFPRRYFYPPLHTLPYIKEHHKPIELNNATDISRRILCLPLYPGIDPAVQDIIIDVIKKEEEHA
jgi:dTDP-4-amino-4,6-dideoxygalactose transaminase